MEKKLRGGSVVKIHLPKQEMQVQSLGLEDLLKKEMVTQVFLPGKSHGQRSLVGCNPRSHRRAGDDLVSKQ